mmetsp:Transcript_3066/g.7299  ORF Transcript_3066/g.7299 Transcript_3066/m.7299 type:complete len:406 (+) Transcript_3066:125-1342(+)
MGLGELACLKQLLWLTIGVAMTRSAPLSSTARPTVQTTTAVPRATPQLPTAPQDTEGVTYTVLGDGSKTYITLTDACIRCTNQKAQHGKHPCAVTRAKLPRDLSDRWGPWPQIETVTDGSRHPNSPTPNTSSPELHTKVLLVPFLHFSSALHNVYHQLLESFNPTLAAARHFGATKIMFRQELPSDKKSSLAEKLLTLAAGSTEGYPLLNETTVCSSKLVLQTSLTADEKAAALTFGVPRFDFAWWDTVEKTPTILLLHRRNSRMVSNRVELLAALRRLSFAVFELSFEDFDISAQLYLARRVTTLIGAHGAGLAFGRLIRPDGGIVELSPFPCIHKGAPGHREGFHSWMRAPGRSYKLIPSINRDLKSHCANQDADPRAFNVTTNITAVIEAVRRMDPILRHGE